MDRKYWCHLHFCEWGKGVNGPGLKFQRYLSQNLASLMAHTTFSRVSMTARRSLARAGTELQIKLHPIFLSLGYFIKIQTTVMETTESLEKGADEVLLKNQKQRAQQHHLQSDQGIVVERQARRSEIFGTTRELEYTLK